MAKKVKGVMTHTVLNKYEHVGKKKLAGKKLSKKR